jgi:hypothetical protein
VFTERKKKYYVVFVNILIYNVKSLTTKKMV